MKAALFVNEGRRNAEEFSVRLCDSAAARGIEIVKVVIGDQPVPAVDLVLAAGGDGTMLEAAGVALTLDVPVLGFDFGTVGFLTEANPRDMAQILDGLGTGNYRLKERMTIEALLPDGSAHTGVNDVVVEKIESQRLVVLELSIDSEPFISYRADGVVIATPTGSTAYSFSARGPLVDPRVDALLVTPVAPHSLFDRTVVLPTDVVLDCRVARDRPVQVSVDGRGIGTLTGGDAVRIRRGERAAKFIEVDGLSFGRRITDRLGLS